MHESQDQTHWRHLIRRGHSDDFGGSWQNAHPGLWSVFWTFSLECLPITLIHVFDHYIALYVLC